MEYEDTTNKEHRHKKMRRETWEEPYESVLKERNELRQTVAKFNEKIDQIDGKLSMSKYTVISYIAITLLSKAALVEPLKTCQWSGRRALYHF